MYKEKKKELNILMLGDYNNNMQTHFVVVLDNNIIDIHANDLLYQVSF